MKLITIESHKDAPRLLWDLLAERPDFANISHREMPSWTSHLAFISEHPYRDWRIITVNDEPVGAIYLTMQNEIGIGILKAHQRKGYATAAIMMLMTEYGPRRYLANVAPTNPASRRMFEKLGFKFIQETLALDGN